MMQWINEHYINKTPSFINNINESQYSTFNFQYNSALLHNLPFSLTSNQISSIGVNKVNENHF